MVILLVELTSVASAREASAIVGLLQSKFSTTKQNNYATHPHNNINNTAFKIYLARLFQFLWSSVKLIFHHNIIARNTIAKISEFNILAVQ